jgi:hypothetical protein
MVRQLLFVISILHIFIQKAMMTSMLSKASRLRLLNDLRGKNVLLVGEGDFGFASALSKMRICKSIVASTMDSEEYLYSSFQASRQNVQDSISHGTRVQYGVDGTKLHNNNQMFDIVLWNFPHIKGKQNIKWNRELLVNFLSSARSCLSVGGIVKMSLCRGQSGLSVKSVEEWNRSWKLAPAGKFTHVEINMYKSIYLPHHVIAYIKTNSCRSRTRCERC